MKKIIIALVAASLSTLVFAVDAKKMDMTKGKEMHKHHMKHHHDKKHHHDMNKDMKDMNKDMKDMSKS